MNLCRHRKFQAIAPKEPKQFGEDLPVTLWIELLPIEGQFPEEYRSAFSHDGGFPTRVRNWTFISAEHTKDVMVTIVPTGPVTSYVTKIGKYQY